MSIFDKQRVAQSDNEGLTDLMPDKPPTGITPPADNSKTTLWFENPEKNNNTLEDKKNISDEMNNLVVGWVVITKGAGKGCFRPLGYGKNNIGRSYTQRVSLDFGLNSDLKISMIKHATITYDSRGKKYYLHSGDGENLTYLNSTDVPILTPVELMGGEEIFLGETTLSFVPFCGSKFDWQSNC